MYSQKRYLSSSISTDHNSLTLVLKQTPNRSFPVESLDRCHSLQSLILLSLFIEVKAAIAPDEERYDRVEGQTLTVDCPFNIMKYASSRKAWQRLPDGKEPLTLVVTERSFTKPSEVHMGKFTLKDDPTEAMLHVQMTDLQVADSGLYRCVIYHPPNDPVLLFHPVRLVVTKGE